MPFVSHHISTGSRLDNEVNNREKHGGLQKRFYKSFKFREQLLLRWICRIKWQVKNEDSYQKSGQEPILLTYKSGRGSGGGLAIPYVSHQNVWLDKPCHGIRKAPEREGVPGGLGKAAWLHLERSCQDSNPQKQMEVLRQWPILPPRAMGLSK